MTTSDTLSQDGLAPTAPDSQLTAENLSLDVGGDSFVYRRFGNEQTPAPALVMLQHFRGNLDNWDPALVDRLAQDRELILVDNRGVGGSSGVVPENVTNMARDALAFIDALALKQIDLLGFSLGGYVAQELVLLRPRLVRRLVLAGTAPQGGPGLHRWSDDVYALATPDEPTAEDLLELFFSGSEQSRAKGMESLERLFQREVDRDEPTDLATRDAQLAAITARAFRTSRSSPSCRHNATDAGRQRRQRHDDAHTKQPPARRAPRKRRAADLSGRRPRVPERTRGGVRETMSTRFSNLSRVQCFTDVSSLTPPLAPATREDQGRSTPPEDPPTKGENHVSHIHRTRSLEPDAQAFAEAVATPPFVTELGPIKGREVLDQVQSEAQAVRPDVRTEDRTIPGPDGEVKVRILKPAHLRDPLPVILYTHGGGWVFGGPLTHDRLVRELAFGANAAVVFPDYVRSPEAKYPQANEEAYAGAQWVVDHGRENGLDARGW